MKSRVIVFIVLAVLGGAGLAWHFARVPQPTLEVLAPTAAVTSPAAVDSARQAPASAPAPGASPSSDTSAAERVLATPAGRPFEVSASVHEFCGNTEWLACREVEVFLDEMAAEPRDAEWAATMESRIGNALVRGMQGHARIRSLECRRSQCAVEYAMPAELADQPFEADLSFDGALVSNTGVVLPEPNPATGTFIVNVLTWRKADARE